MKTISLNFLFLLLCMTISAQDAYYEDYDWDKNPSYSVEPGTTEEAMEIRSKMVTEFLFKRGELEKYYLEHKVIWLNSDHAIENYNRLYLPYSDDSELEESKARVVTASGKVKELDKSDIHTAENEETGRKYKYFALEGIEKGSFIEYLYVEKQEPRYSGTRIFFQSSIKSRNIEYDFYAPRNLVFVFKSYNGLPGIAYNHRNDEKNHWQMNLKEQEKLEEEDLSAYDALRAALVYKLDRANDMTNISSYEKLSKNVFSYYYPEEINRAGSRLKRFIAEVLGGERSNEVQIIRKLENEIKNNFFVSDGKDEDLEDLDKVLDKKIANEDGIIKLYAALFSALHIDHELVLTSNRSDIKFDPHFEAVNFLGEFLFYFPNTGLYFSPVNTDSRLGFPPPYLTDNYGLFIDKVTLGNISSGKGEVKYIEPVPSEESVEKMLIEVNFDKDDHAVINVHMERSMTGYYAMYFQPFMNLIKPEDKKDIIEGFAKNLDEGAEILEKQVVNGKPELFGVKPFQVILDFNSDAFVEKAGNKYIFNVGELIGSQSELYEEKERTLPVENAFQKTYIRTIKVKIPEGFTFANLDDLQINNSYVREGEEIMSFKSSYEIKDGFLMITANEHYSDNLLTKEEYSQYRKVINSAADFNKVRLVMEPVQI